MSIFGNSFPERILRRSITIPAFVVLFGVAVAVYLPGLIVCLVLDKRDAPRSNWPRCRAATFFLLYLFSEMWGIAAALLIWGVTLGGVVTGGARQQRLYFALQRLWSGSLFWGAVRIFSMKVEGLESIEHPDQAHLLLVRHASTADTVLAAAVLANPKHLRYRYVLKTELLLDPCLDLVGNQLPNAFIDRESRDMTSQLERMRALAPGIQTDSRAGLLIFPEGTRYSRKKFARAIERLWQRGEPEMARKAATLNHTLPPRTAGTATMLEALPSSDILILGHTGFEGARSFQEFWSGALIGKTIHARTWIHPRSTIPQERDAFNLWLLEQWQQLDAWIDSTSASGSAAVSA